MSQQILVQGIDPTSFQQITGAQLKSLVSAATFAVGIGGVIITTDAGGLPSVPAANVDTTLQTFIWIRIGVAAVSAYIWNPIIPSQPTYLNWSPLVNAALGVNTVTGGVNGNIALSTITPDNISSVSGSQVVGSLSASALANLVGTTTNAGGVLSGTFATLAFVANTLALSILTSVGSVNKAVPVIADQVILFDSATSTPVLAKYSTITQIFNNCLYNALAAKAIPIAADQVALFDSASANAPKYSPISSLLGNLANKAAPIAADSIVILDSTTSNPTVAKQATITNLLNNASIYKTALSTALAGSTSALIFASTAHGITNPLRAELFLQCITNDSSFSVGDIIAFGGFSQGDSNVPNWIQVQFNATNVWITESTSASMSVSKKDGSGTQHLTFANWKAYAVVYGY
jgi:hypothetical protein